MLMNEALHDCNLQSALQNGRSGASHLAQAAECQLHNAAHEYMNAGKLLKAPTSTRQQLQGSAHLQRMLRKDSTSHKQC
jgi:hypothetical protein